MRCSVYTGEYALPSSGSLPPPAVGKGTKRGRDAPARPTAPKRPAAAVRSAAVADPCSVPGRTHGDAAGGNGRRNEAVKPEQRRGAAAAAVVGEADDDDDFALVQDTPDTLGGDSGRGLPEREPRRVAITAEEEARLRQAAAEADGLQQELRALQQRSAAQARHADEQDAAVESLRAELQQCGATVAQQERCLAAERAEAEAASAERTRLQTRADELARENEGLRKRVRPAALHAHSVAVRGDTSAGGCTAALVMCGRGAGEGGGGGGVGGGDSRGRAEPAAR